MQYAIIHYSEIGIKKGNRKFFEKILSQNVKRALSSSCEGVSLESGKIVAKLKNESELKNLSKIPGIANYAPAIKTVTDLKELKEAAIKLATDDKHKTFRIETSRNWKEFALTSQQVNERVGDSVQRITKKQVKLKNPGLTIHIEIGSKSSYAYKNKQQGIGGMPVGSAGRVVSLISGGIDSPVASYLMMKRGARVILVHFANQTYATRASVSKVVELARKLNDYQRGLKLYVVPFEKFQKEIIVHVTPKHRMLVYRRAMYLIAEQVMRKEGAQAIITGDSLSQVASQTLENLNAVRAVTRKVILSPLIGMNKEEIITLAKKIGTYETSIKPYPDCCSYLIGNHPETRGKAKELEEMEREIPVKELVEECITKAEVIKF